MPFPYFTQYEWIILRHSCFFVNVIISNLNILVYSNEWSSATICNKGDTFNNLSLVNLNDYHYKRTSQYRRTSTISNHPILPLSCNHLWSADFKSFAYEIPSWILEGILDSHYDNGSISYSFFDNRWSFSLLNLLRWTSRLILDSMGIGCLYSCLGIHYEPTIGLYSIDQFESLQ